MKTKLLLLICPVLLIGCQSHDTEKEKQEEHSLEASNAVLQADTTNPIDQVYPTGENEEYLDWGSVRVNGKFPLITSVKNIEGILGRADSVVSINWMETCSSRYRNEDSRNAYFGGAEFEQFGDSLDLFQVNFNKDHSVFLQNASLKLNHATTLEEVEEQFPKAVKGIKKGFYLIDGKETDAINLPPSKELSDAQWILMFQQGKLIRVDLWFPC